MIATTGACRRWDETSAEFAWGDSVTIAAVPLQTGADSLGTPAAIAPVGRIRDGGLVAIAMDRGATNPLVGTRHGIAQAWARWGAGPGEFQATLMITATDQQFVLLDPVRRVIARFEGSGVFRGEHRLPATFVGIPVLGERGAAFTLNARSGIATVQYLAPSGRLDEIPTGLPWRKGAALGALLQVSAADLLAFRDRDGCIFTIGLRARQTALDGCLPSRLRTRIHRVGERVFGPIANRLVGHEAPAVPFRFLGAIDSEWVVMGFEEPGFMANLYALDVGRWILHPLRILDRADRHPLVPVTIAGRGDGVLLADDRLFTFSFQQSGHEAPGPHAN